MAARPLGARCEVIRGEAVVKLYVGHLLIDPHGIRSNVTLPRERRCVAPRNGEHNVAEAWVATLHEDGFSQAEINDRKEESIDSVRFGIDVEVVRVGLHVRRRLKRHLNDLVRHPVHVAGALYL